VTGQTQVFLKSVAEYADFWMGNGEAEACAKCQLQARYNLPVKNKVSKNQIQSL